MIRDSILQWHLRYTERHRFFPVHLSLLDSLTSNNRCSFVFSTFNTYRAYHHPQFTHLTLLYFLTLVLRDRGFIITFWHFSTIHLTFQLCYRFTCIFLTEIIYRVKLLALSSQFFYWLLLDFLDLVISASKFHWTLLLVFVQFPFIGLIIICGLPELALCDIYVALLKRLTVTTIVLILISHFLGFVVVIKHRNNRHSWTLTCITLF